MSKIDFDDGSSIELRCVDDKYVIILKAKDYENPLKKIVSSCSLDKSEFISLVKEYKDVLV